MVDNRDVMNSQGGSYEKKKIIKRKQIRIQSIL